MCRDSFVVVGACETAACFLVVFIYISFLIHVLVRRLIPPPDLVLQSVKGFDNARDVLVVLRMERDSLRPVSKQKLRRFFSIESTFFWN